ncbi:hypothetical protein NDU88_010863 [Pleurodeles waltl]|uniref:Uncharacterized protein n=1 Tax=Pleurodeles waltl TaxID=8319 RepID=A0AAV7PXA1_PLEWA|nr:hypothetical protein NDU88_010863 [Pleurodeles waltl]
MGAMDQLRSKTKPNPQLPLTPLPTARIKPFGNGITFRVYLFTGPLLPWDDAVKCAGVDSASMIRGLLRAACRIDEQPKSMTSASGWREGAGSGPCSGKCAAMVPPAHSILTSLF